MKTIRLSVAQALVKFLDNQYVSFQGKQSKFVHGIYGIFGHGNVTGLGEAIENEAHQLKFYQGNNEQGMVHAATAFAKQSNRLQIMACTSSIGPGALNMVTGAATATINRIPVLLLPGDIFVDRQPDPVLQQLEVPHDATQSVNDCFKPVSKFWDRLTHPQQLMNSLLQAFRVLTDPVETGAVTICLPQDVQAQCFDFPETFFDPRVHFIEPQAASERAVNEVFELLKQSKKPLIIAGGGVHYSQATDTLSAFARNFSIPVCETQAGKSALIATHEQNVGGMGVCGSSAANILARDADLILAVGTRLSDFTTCSKTAFANDAKLIQLNISSFDSVKTDAIPLVGDADATLNALSKKLQGSGYQTEAVYQRYYQSLRNEWLAEVEKVVHPSGHEGNSQAEVVGMINQAIDPDAVICCAAGSLPGDLLRIWQSTSVNNYHLEYGFSCMGYEVAGALGIKIANPEKEVYAIVGDGSFLMLHSELFTSLKERIKINVILLDNSGFQCIRNLQCANGSKGFGNEFKYKVESENNLVGDTVQVDFAKYAEALGVKAFKAHDVSELKSCIEQARQSTVSTLIEVKVAPGTMTHGYESWWRVDVPEVSNAKEVKKAHKDNTAKLKTAKTY